jgi:membrane-associated protease RseP (regulator of RpoE activity)
MTIPRCWLALAAALVLCLPAHAGEKPAPQKSDGKGVAVPYKLTDSLHVLVRVKINGKGPLNFIVDTGAPIVFVSKEAAKKVGLEADKRGFAVIDRLDVEGGVVAKNTKSRVETVYQLEGMNAMGLAGVELHGILGYNLLAHYKMELDFTKNKMTWTPLAFEPPPLIPISGKGPAGMEAMGGILKFLSAFLGKTLPGPPNPRGFLGMELADSDGDYVLVKAVLQDGPAAKAGLKSGDHITRFQGNSVSSLTSLQRMAAKLTASQQVRLTVERDGKKHELNFRAGGGL